MVDLGSKHLNITETDEDGSSVSETERKHHKDPLRSETDKKNLDMEKKKKSNKIETLAVEHTPSPTRPMSLKVVDTCVPIPEEGSPTKLQKSQREVTTSKDASPQRAIIDDSEDSSDQIVRPKKSKKGAEDETYKQFTTQATLDDFAKKDTANREAVNSTGLDSKEFSGDAGQKKPPKGLDLSDKNLEKESSDEGTPKFAKHDKDEDSLGELGISPVEVEPKAPVEMTPPVITVQEPENNETPPKDSSVVSEEKKKSSRDIFAEKLKQKTMGYTTKEKPEDKDAAPKIPVREKRAPVKTKQILTSEALDESKVSISNRSNTNMVTKTAASEKEISSSGKKRIPMKKSTNLDLNASQPPLPVSPIEGDSQNVLESPDLTKKYSTTVMDEDSIQKPDGKKRPRKTESSLNAFLKMSKQISSPHKKILADMKEKKADKEGGTGERKTSE